MVSLAVLGGLAGGMLVVSGLVPSALATSNVWADENAGFYVDSDLAEIDDASHPNRCEGREGIPGGLDPGWVRTSGSPSPYVPVTETLGQVLDPRDYLNPNMNIDGHEGNGMSNPFVAIGDNTFNHYARDLNVFLTPDFVYRNQMATGNFKNGYNSQEFANFEVEWERGAVPKWAMPARGDRLRVYGPLIFDCGHGNEGPYGQDDEYRTEIHPPVGWVVYRQTADADGVPQNNKQNLAWKWYEPTDLRAMATTLPSTDLHDTLVRATVADTFFSSFGGNVIESLNGCDDNGDLEVGTGAAAPCYVSARFHNDAALDTYEWGSDVLNQDYNFTVPAPPRPVGAPAHSDLLYEIEEMCGSIPSDPTFPNKGLAEWEDGPESAYHDDRGIGTATCNPNSPYEVSVDRVGDAYWNETGQPAIRFRLRAKTGADGTDGTVDDPVYPANDYLAFAYRIKVAWDWVPGTAADYRTTRVDFDTLNVHHNGEDSTDGEWLMELRANETRTYPVRGDAGFDDNDGDKINEPFYEDGAIDDNPGVDTYEIGSPGKTAVTHRVDLLPGEQVRIWEKTIESDEPDADDFLHVNQSALTPPTGHQTTTHEVGQFNALWWGNHTIGVKLTDETIKPPDKATLEFYGGWKDPITGRRRVRATDPVRVWSDTNDVRYRIWKEGDTPGPWINVWDFPNPFGAFVLRPGNPIYDGLYNIEWAAMREDPGTGKVHVSPYQWTQFELDNTKPTLNLPPNLFVEATETGGAVVDYAGQVSAADNFDPQPTLDHGTNPTIECVPPSGSLFPNGQNAPKTTSVACQARDAVGNTTTGTFTVTVNSPFGYLNEYVILGSQWAEIGGQSHVFSGNVGGTTRATAWRTHPSATPTSSWPPAKTRWWRSIPSWRPKASGWRPTPRQGACGGSTSSTPGPAGPIRRIRATCPCGPAPPSSRRSRQVGST